MMSYRKLTVHQRALELTDRVFDLVESPALERRYWFQRQLSEAVGSVSSNIAEGNGRSTPLDYASFLDRARGSLFEVDNWVNIATRRGWCGRQTQAELEGLIDEISAMLFRMASQLRKKSALESRANA